MWLTRRTRAVLASCARHQLAPCPARYASRSSKPSAPPAPHAREAEREGEQDDEGERGDGAAARSSAQSKKSATLPWSLKQLVDTLTPDLAASIVQQLLAPALSALSPSLPLSSSAVAAQALAREEAQREYEADKARLAEALHAQPAHAAVVYAQKATLLLRRFELDEALGNADKALILDPSLSVAAECRAAVLKKAKWQPHDAHVRYILGTAYLELGLFVSAMREFNAALAADPTHKEALYNRFFTSEVLKALEERAVWSSEGRPTPQDLHLVPHYDYAVLAARAYADERPVAPLPPAWCELVSSDAVRDSDGSYSRDGYFGVCFVNAAARELVIAHRGSDSHMGTLTSLQYMWGEIDRQMLCAELFAEHVVQLRTTHYTDYELVFVGHSMGGAQAEYMALLFQARLPTERVRAITFDCPGVGGLLPKLASVHGIVPRDFAHITGYLSRPNLINIARPHVGRRVRLYPALPLKTPFRTKGSAVVRRLLAQSKKYLAYVIDFNDEHSNMPERLTHEVALFLEHWERMVLETLHWHAVRGFVRTLELEAQYNIVPPQRAVHAWPRMDTFSSYYNVTKECASSEPDVSVLGHINRATLQRAHYAVSDAAPYLLTPEHCGPELWRALLALLSRAPAAHVHAHFDEPERRVLAATSIVRDAQDAPVAVRLHPGPLTAAHMSDFLWKRRERVLCAAATQPEPS